MLEHCLRTYSVPPDDGKDDGNSKRVSSEVRESPCRKRACFCSPDALLVVCPYVGHRLTMLRLELTLNTSVFSRQRVTCSYFIQKSELSVSRPDFPIVSHDMENRLLLSVPKKEPPMLLLTTGWTSTKWRSSGPTRSSARTRRTKTEPVATSTPKTWGG